MTRVAGLLAAAALAAAMVAGWSGIVLGPLEWSGAWAVLGDTWLWDLRWPMLPACAVAVLWAAERIAAWSGPGR